MFCSLIRNFAPDDGPLIWLVAQRRGEILANARKRAYTAVNFAMVESYWLIGQQIVEHEQHGEARADYGKGLLKELAARLTTDFGKGFDERELRKMRQFYQTFPKRDTLRPELTWSHYRRMNKENGAPLSPLLTLNLML